MPAESPLQQLAKYMPSLPKASEDDVADAAQVAEPAVPNDDPRFRHVNNEEVAKTALAWGESHGPLA